MRVGDLVRIGFTYPPPWRPAFPAHAAGLAATAARVTVEQLFSICVYALIDPEGQ